MSWQAIAERAARARCGEILAQIEAAIAEHAPGADVKLEGDDLRIHGRGLSHRWIAEPGLRFARRIFR